MPELFYQLIRVFFKGTAESPTPSHSVQYFPTFEEAEKRYYAVIASDIANAEVIYHEAYIINSKGVVREYKVFDRRVWPEPEPEPIPPAPEPEPEPEPEEDEPEEEVDE